MEEGSFCRAEARRNPISKAPEGLHTATKRHLPPCIPPHIHALPQQAAQVIKALHAQLAANAAHTQELVGQLNRLSAAAEDLSDENSALRGKAGLPPGAGLDVAGLRLQKETTIAQLRSVNVLLERQVGWALNRWGEGGAMGGCNCTPALLFTPYACSCAARCPHPPNTHIHI